jgi:3-oxoacyl-[acyl-carrier-protein] synthase II
MNHAMIRGMGWVSESSRGYPGQVLCSKEPHGLPRISGKEILDRPHKAFGRMDPFSKVGFAAITFALADAGIVRSESKKNIAVIASSVAGCLETDITYQATLSREKGILPSPTLFAYTLPSCFLGEATIYHGLTGESFMVEEEIPNGLQGLSLGLDLLEDGGCDALVCGLCNSNIKGVGPINTAFPEPGALFFVFEKQKSKSGHGSITENKTQNIFSHGNKIINSLTDLGKNILAKKTN